VAWLPHEHITAFSHPFHIFEASSGFLGDRVTGRKEREGLRAGSPGGLPQLGRYPYLFW